MPIGTKLWISLVLFFCGLSMEKIIYFLSIFRQSRILKSGVMNLKIHQILPIVAIWWVATAACGMITGITITKNLKDKNNDRKDDK